MTTIVPAPKPLSPASLYRRDGFGVLLHAVEHMAYHTGQIVLLGKQLAGARVQIEFYPHLKESPPARSRR